MLHPSLSVASSREDFRQKFAHGENQIVYQWVVSDCDTPVSVFLKLKENEDYAFLLESVEGGEKLGRYTILGFNPDLVWTCADYRAANTSPLDDLREILARSSIILPDENLPPMASSGLFGYMGYDMIRVVEQIPDDNPDQLGIEDAIFIRPRLLVIFDNVTNKICVVCPVYDHDANPSHHTTSADVQDSPMGGQGCTRADEIYDQTVHYLSTVINRLHAPLVPKDYHSDLATPLNPISNMTIDQYFAMVEKGKDYIRAGDIFQFVPSQRFQIPFDLPPFELYRSLRRLNPSPFLFYIQYPHFALVGSSPEILVRVREGEVTIRPIAGTRPRGKNSTEDQELRAGLLNDPKELAEHLMLLDLGRNDVGKVSEIGSVTVTEQFAVENYSHVMHIVSNVTGQLNGQYDALDALMSGFPAGTVSGAPKIRAMEIIDELEPVKRKFYGGCVGYLAGNGSIDTCIALRTCVVKDGIVTIQAGGGVVADSVPQCEYDETVNKSKAILRAAEDAVHMHRFLNKA